MIVQCENCQTKFNVNPDRIKDEGSNVRCSNCKHVFKIYKPKAEPLSTEKPEQPAVPPPPPQAAPPADKKKDEPSPTTDESLDGWDTDEDFGDLDDQSAGDDSFEDGMTGFDTPEEIGTDSPDGESPGDADFGSDPDDEISGDFDFNDLDGDLDIGAAAENLVEDAAADGLGDADFGSDSGDEIGGGFDFDDLDGDLDLGAPMENGVQDGAADGLGDADFGSDSGDEIGGGFDFGDLDGDLDLGAPVENSAEAPAMDFLAGEDIGDGFDFGDFDGDLSSESPDGADNLEDTDFNMDFSDSGDQSGDDMDFGDFEDLTIGEPVTPTPEQTLGIASVSDDDELDFGNLGDDFDLGEPDTLVEDHQSSPAIPDDEGGGLDDLDLKASSEDFAGFAGEEVPEDDDSLDFGDQFSELGADVDLNSASPEDAFSDLDLGDATDAGMDEISPMDDISPADDGEDLLLYGGEEDESPLAEKKPLSGRKKKLLWAAVGICGILALFAGLFFLAPTILDPVLKPLGLSANSYDPAKDPDGNQYLSIDQTAHSFETNQYVGNILVISGVVVNQYSHPRSHIRVKGMLHSKAGESLLGVKQVYGGNWLTKDEVQTLPYNEMLERLRQKSGQNNANQDVQPGESVKFMIVFDQIPETLGSYTVEALGSDPSGSSK